MTRIAATRIRFVETSVEIGRESWGAPTGTTFREYNVEVHQGARRQTIGRISGVINSAGSSWMGLPIGAQAWTCRHTTRKAALAALLIREDWQAVRAAQDAAAYALTA